MAYDDLFEDHMRIAKERFIQKYGREPTFYELLEEHTKLMDSFFD